MLADTFDALVIGGGINGLSALYHLRRLGAERLGLVEQFFIGHDRGSSHGAARITRSAYGEPEYVRLMQWVHAEEWPRLEKDAGRQLLYPSPGLFIGPPCEYFNKYIQAVQQEGVEVEAVTPAEAGGLYPQFTFENVETALLDKTASIVSAQETIESLAALARRNGVTLIENTPVHEIDPGADPVTVTTGVGTLKAERLVVAAGAWTGQLLPFLKPRLTVARQTVGYFTPAGNADAYQPGRFPVWMYMGEENDVFYGMPEFGRAGVKVARHVRYGADDDPDDPPDSIGQDKIDDIARFMAGFFTSSGWTLADAEHCLYTVAPNEDFIIDLHPDNPRIAIGAGFSGHGFKFGPLTGRLLAELAWDGRISIPEAGTARRLFSLHDEGSLATPGFRLSPE